MTQRKGEPREEYLARLRERVREYTVRNHTRVILRDRERYAARREECRERERRYYATHRECITAYEQERRQTPEGAMQVKAGTAVTLAIAAGRLCPPSVCQQCGRSPGLTLDGRRLVHAHHHLGYAPENHLDVQWLCKSCHARADSAHQGNAEEAV